MKTDNTISTVIKPMLHTEHLEQLIDAYGLPCLLAEFSDIAYGKADHSQTNWQDKTLAAQWTRVGNRLAKLGNGIPRL